MLEHQLQVLFGTDCPSFSEKLLIDNILSLTIKITDIGNFDEKISIKNVGRTSLLLVIPIFGDNDLLESHFKSISLLANDPNLIGRKIIIALKGDRHISDEKFEEGTSIRKKLENIFFFSESIYFCHEKLDIDTSQVIAEEIAQYICQYQSEKDHHIEIIAKILGKKVRWDNVRRLLDFYDKSTGFSLLYERESAEIAATFECLPKIDIKTLLMTNASLNDEALKMISQPLKIQKLDLSGNCFTLRQVFETFESPDWLSIAANQATNIQLADCPKTLQSLYLHKNNIKSLSISANLPCQIKELSLYRNQLQEFILPADQKEFSRINLGANPISSLSESLSQSRKLKFLGIARTNIKSLPDWLFDMKSLIQLDISHIEDNIPKSQLDKLVKKGITLIKKPKY